MGETAQERECPLGTSDTSVAQVIQQVVAPAVMISACGLLCLAQYSRLAAIVARLRQFHEKRFEIYEIMSTSTESEKPLLTVRFEGISEQADHILQRARAIRNGLMCLVGCILCMLASSLTIGLSLTIESVQPAVVGLFILGVLSMSAAMVFACAELRSSLKEVEYEHERIKHLGQPDRVTDPLRPLESNL